VAGSDGEDDRLSSPRGRPGDRAAQPPGARRPPDRRPGPRERPRRRAHGRLAGVCRQTLARGRTARDRARDGDRPAQRWGGVDRLRPVPALRWAGVRGVHILDLRHAEEHLWEVARLCLGEGTAGWIEAPLETVREGRGDALLAAVRQLPTTTAEAATQVATTRTSFATRRPMLAYPRFRAAGYQIGSGITESAYKRLVSQREKGPGMPWTTPGAQAIATLRAAHLSNRWDEAVEVARAA